VNTFITAFTGTPFSVKLGNTDNSGTGEFQDRAVQTGNPTAGLSRKLASPTPGASPVVQWISPAAYTQAPQGSFGTVARNSVYGPSFFTTDASLVKNTYIREGINLQLRAEMFNIFNHVNLATPLSSTALSSSSFGQITSTRNNSGAPGIGPGEPFNVQLAGKIIF
jgi:hypothetical protein